VSPTGGQTSPTPPTGGSTGGGQQLAETGGGNEALVLAPIGALVTAGGVLLYRRSRRPAK
jgi:LPXTG-motif cell wall-anchored protein